MAETNCALCTNSMNTIGWTPTNQDRAVCEDCINNKKAKRFRGKSPIFSSDGKTISGTFAFWMMATHGLPFETLSDIALNSDWNISEEEFQECLKVHRDISKQGRD